MVDLDVSATDLVVRPKGWHRLWALRREVRVPLARVTGARVEDRPGRSVRGLRAPGTYLPGVLVAGTYRRRRGKDFADARLNRPAVVVDLAGAAFDRIVVGVDDPAGAVARIEAARAR